MTDSELDKANMSLRWGNHEEAKAAYNVEEAKKLTALLSKQTLTDESKLALLNYVGNFETIHKEIKDIRDNFDTLIKTAVAKKEKR